MRKAEASNFWTLTDSGVIIVNRVKTLSWWRSIGKCDSSSLHVQLHIFIHCYLPKKWSNLEASETAESKELQRYFKNKEARAEVWYLFVGLSFQTQNFSKYISGTLFKYRYVTLKKGNFLVKCNLEMEHCLFMKIRNVFGKLNIFYRVKNKHLLTAWGFKWTLYQGVEKTPILCNILETAWQRWLQAFRVIYLCWHVPFWNPFGLFPTQYGFLWQITVMLHGTSLSVFFSFCIKVLCFRAQYQNEACSVKV